MPAPEDAAHSHVRALTRPSSSDTTAFSSRARTHEKPSSPAPRRYLCEATKRAAFGLPFLRSLTRKDRCEQEPPSRSSEVVRRGKEVQTSPATRASSRQPSHWIMSEGWWARVESNHRPPACEADALPLSHAPDRIVSVSRLLARSQLRPRRGTFVAMYAHTWRGGCEVVPTPLCIA
jgi:hypothetical protein